MSWKWNADDKRFSYPITITSEGLCKSPIDVGRLYSVNWALSIIRRFFCSALHSPPKAIIVQNLPFNKPGRFYKGNLHTHSTRSDGRLTPEQVCATYRELGYDFLSMTDHFLKQYQFPITDTSALRAPDFTTLIGAELHTGQTEGGELWHILAVGLPLDFAQPAPNETAPEMAVRALASGAFVAAAHPAWYNLSESDIRSLGDIDAIEVYNGIADGHNDRADSWHIMDTLTSRGYRYSACATDDAHFDPKLNDVGRGWVWVRAEALTPEALIDGLKAGWYYSSTGPQIFDIHLQARGRMTVRCSPASSIYVSGAGSVFRHQHGAGLMSAEFELGNFKSPYCRVTVRSADGGRAWSNPIWF